MHFHFLGEGQMLAAAQAAAIAKNMLMNSKPYLIVDGNWLRKEIIEFRKKFFGEEHLEYDWFKTYEQNEKTLYFDAYPTQKRSQTAEQFEEEYRNKQKELDHINSIDNTHTRTGMTLGEKKSKLRQKGVDIMLAIECMSLASRGVCNNFLFYIGDLDFLPLILSLIDLGSKVEIRHSKSTNKLLIQAADKKRELNIYEYLRFLPSNYSLPKEIAATNNENEAGEEYKSLDGSCRAVIKSHENGLIAFCYRGEDMVSTIWHESEITLKAFISYTYGIEIT